MKKTLFIAFLIASASLLSHADRNRDLFPPTFPIENAALELKGVSKLTVKLLFDVYVAAFYQLPESGPTDALADQPRHLEIHYLRNISRQAFIDAGDDMLKRQHAPDTLRTIQAGIDAINALYEDVRQGDRYALTYIPGQGTELRRNGESKGVIPGADFARIYFSIWLGENNPYLQFRNRLVGLN